MCQPKFIRALVPILALLSARLVAATEYRAGYWLRFAIAGITFARPIRRAEALSMSVGWGASRTRRLGFGVGSALMEGCEVSGDEMVTSAFPVHVCLMMPLVGIAHDLEDAYPTTLSLSVSGSPWADGGAAQWVVTSAGLDVACGFLGIEGGFAYVHGSTQRPLTTLFAGVRVGLSSWFAYNVTEYVAPPPQPKPRPVPKKRTVATPQLRLRALDGRNWALGQTTPPSQTVLYFWTPMDSAMKEDMKALDRLARQAQPGALRVTGVLAFPDDTIEARQFVARAGIVFENAIVDSAFSRKLGLTNTAPAVVIFDRDWDVALKRTTGLNDGLIRYIEDAKPPPPPPPPPEETVYVSGLAPTRVERCELEKDAFRGRPIVIRGTTYQRGLHTHAPALVSYNLNRQFKRFESDIGLWDAGNPNRGVPGDFAGDRGSVIFQVWLDGKKVYDSGVMDWDDRKSISVSVAGAQQMDLIVETVENNRWDWSVWGGAKLIK